MKLPTKEDNVVVNTLSYIKGKYSSLYGSIPPEKITLFVILVVAFVQGVVSLSDLSVQYLYKDDYHMTPAEVSIAAGITGLPWIVKPIWGMISDNIPLLGYRRKSYLMFCGFGSALCYFSLSSFPTVALVGISLLLTSTVCVSFASVIGEALIVESAQNNNAKKEMTEEDKQSEASNQVSFFFGVKNIGILITSYAGGWLLGFVSKYTVFFITMMFPMIAGMSSWLLPEKRVGEKNSQQAALAGETTIEVVSAGIRPIANEPTRYLQGEQSAPGTEETRLLAGSITNSSSAHEPVTIPHVEEDNWSKIVTFIKNPAIYKPVIFIFLFSATPSAGSAMFFFYTNELGFTTEFMGEIQLASALASVTGIWIFNRWFKNVPFVKIFVWSALICTLGNLSQILLVTRWNTKLGMGDKFFCLTGNLLIQVFAELNLIPILVLACRICPKNVEGTMYALLMSILNFGSMIANEWGALNTWLLGITETNFDNLWLLITIASITTLAPLPFIGMIDFEKALQVSEGINDHAVITEPVNEEEARIVETIIEKSEEMVGDNTLSCGDYEKI